jgi:hypothetical protein
MTLSVQTLEPLHFAALDRLSLEDRRLLLNPPSLLGQLIALQEGRILPNTEAREHFVLASRGACEASTDYELAYLRFLAALRAAAALRDVNTSMRSATPSALHSRMPNARIQTPKDQSRKLVTSVRRCAACGRDLDAKLVGSRPLVAAGNKLCPTCYRLRVQKKAKKQMPTGRVRIDVHQQRKHQEEQQKKYQEGKAA